MRTRLRIFVLLAAGVLELVAASPAPAQLVAYDEPVVIESSAERRRKLYVRRAISGVIFGGTAFLIAIFLVLNAIDRRAARKALIQKQLERYERGLM